jgi:uridine kinase
VLKAAREDRVTMVAIDGVDGAGKSTFGDELAGQLRRSGRPLIRATVDSFHQPRAQRYVRGRNSPEGYYRDSYDYPALKAALLDPLRAGEQFRRAVLDVDRDEAVDSDPETAAPGSILIFDGIFLHRPELRDYWDLSVYLHVPWEKNHHLPGHPEWNVARYAEGQAIYLRECDPPSKATIVIDNTDLAQPLVVSWRHHA